MKQIILSAVLTLSALAAPASPPVAVVTSGGTFTIKGVKIAAVGVPDWPLVAGDVIATGESSALIKFSDGSRVTIAAHTRASLEKAGERVRLRLRSGSLSYRLSASGSTEVAGLDLPAVPSKYTEGALSATGSSSWFYPAGVSNGAAVIPAAPTVITPFNLGYLNSLRNTPDNAPPPLPPAPIIDPNRPLPAISATTP